MPERAERQRRVFSIAPVAAVLGLVVFAVYLPTVAPTVTLRNGGGDGGELTRAAWSLGVPHPTGYPLWVIFAHAATALPFGEPAHRVALFSTLAAAAALAFVALLGHELLAQAAPETAAPLALAGPALGAACLAFSPLFWQQATIPETYALDSCLVALGLWLLLRWLRGVQPLWTVTLVAALALANHLVSVALLAAVVVGILVRRPRPARPALAIAALPFLSTLGLYLFLLIRARAHPVADWGDPQTLGALWSHVTGSEYRHFLTSRSIGDQLLEIARSPERLRQQFMVFGALAAVWSLLTVLTRAWRAALVLAVALLVDLAIVARDAAPAGPAYLHVAYLVLAAALGAGLVVVPASLVGDGRQRRLASVVGCVGGAALALVLLWQVRPRVTLQGDVALKQTAQADLAAAPSGALLLTQGDNPLFAMWYLQDVLGVRTDVIVWSLNLVLDPWYGKEMHARYPTVIPANLPEDMIAAADQLIGANLRRRPVASTIDTALLTNRYQLQQDGPVWLVLQQLP